MNCGKVTYDNGSAAQVGNVPPSSGTPVSAPQQPNLRAKQATQAAAVTEAGGPQSACESMWMLASPLRREETRAGPAGSQEPAKLQELAVRPEAGLSLLEGEGMKPAVLEHLWDPMVSRVDG